MLKSPARIIHEGGSGSAESHSSRKVSAWSVLGGLIYIEDGDWHGGLVGPVGDGSYKVGCRRDLLKAT